MGPEEDGNVGTMEKKRQKSVLTYHDNLHQCTVAAMSNLLSANIDAGLTHAIGKYICSGENKIFKLSTFTYTG